MNYDEIKSGLARQAQRRKYFQEQLAKGDPYDPNNMVSGRVVPYSPIQGLSKIAQALINKQGMNAADKKETELNEELTQGRDKAFQNVWDTYSGRDEVLDAADMTTPDMESGIKADPVKAAMMARKDPFLADSGIGAAMMPTQDRSGYTKEIELRNGRLALLDTRTGRMVYAGTDIPVPAEEAIAAKSDWVTRQNLSAADEAGTLQAKSGQMPSQTNGMQPSGVSAASVEADVTTADESSKLVIDELKSKRELANDARQMLISNHEATRLLDAGITSGAFADWRVGFGKTLQQLGINYADDDIANAEAYAGASAQRVAKIIKAFGAGTGLSDADREFAMKAAAGSINLNEESMRRIIDINNRAAKNSIEAYNKYYNSLDNKYLPKDYSVEIPSFDTVDKNKKVPPPNATAEELVEFYNRNE